MGRRDGADGTAPIDADDSQVRFEVEAFFKTRGIDYAQHSPENDGAFLLAASTDPAPRLVENALAADL
jgi:hypothetical protein